MPQPLPPGEFQAIEGEMRLRALGDQITVEMDSSESWYACLTLSAEEAGKLGDWLTLYRLAKK